MTQTCNRLFRIGRKSRPDARRPRRGALPWRVDGLERRALRSIVALPANASPAILQPINPMNQPHAVRVARIRPVTLAGYVIENDDVAPTVSFRVVDEYGRDMPAGTIAPQRFMPGQFFFSTRIGLNLTRRPGDRNGRQYTVFVTAREQASTRTTAIPVTTLPFLHHHSDRHNSNSSN